MSSQYLILYPLIGLLFVLISSNTLQVEALYESKIYLNIDLCRYAGSGSTKIFQKEDINYCKCDLKKQTITCEAIKVDRSTRIHHVLDNFEANLSDKLPNLDVFLYLFASTQNCNNDEDSDTTVSCCLISRNVYNIRPSIQLGIVASLTKELGQNSSSSPEASEFERSMTTHFSRVGSVLLPPHCFKEFALKIYAPSVFKSIRHVLDIGEVEFMLSIGNSENQLRDLGKLGGSGNGFYLTHDDKYFIKTTNNIEYENFLKILPNYFRYISENPRSLLSRFLTLFDYKSSNFESHYFVTNNLLPSDLMNPQKFDLKGSTVNRKTTDKNKQTKKSITLKDSDFMEQYPDGLFIDPEVYDGLMHSLRSDVEFLLSQNCLDYSLLITVVDASEEKLNGVNKDNFNVIPAITSGGENKLVYLGIIDILQPYSNMKKIESSLKSMIYEKSSITIIKPEAYAERFKKFISSKVLKSKLN